MLLLARERISYALCLLPKNRAEIRLIQLLSERASASADVRIQVGMKCGSVPSGYTAMAILRTALAGGPSFRAFCEKVGLLNCDFSASVFIVVKQHQH